MLNNTITTRHISMLAILAFLAISLLVLLGHLNSEPTIETTQSSPAQYTEINKLENASKATSEQLALVTKSLDDALATLNATLQELKSVQSQIQFLGQSLNEATSRLADLETNDQIHDDLIATVTKQVIAFQGENADLKHILDNITKTEQEILGEVHNATINESSDSFNAPPTQLPSTEDAMQKCQRDCPDTIPIAEFSKEVETKIAKFEQACNLTILDTELITSCSNIDEYGLSTMNPVMLNNLPCDDTLYNNYRLGRCAVVSNSGVLLNQSNKTKIFLGKVIDAYDFVVRLNLAPVKGYEKYVGSKTSLRVMDRIAYQSWIELVKNNVSSELVEENSTKVIRYVSNNALKQFDVNNQTYNNNTFLLSKDFGLALSSCEASVAPSFETELKRRGYEATPRTASTGLVAVSMMIPLCDQLHVFGFHSSPLDKLHYFGNNTSTYEKYMKGVKFYNLELEHLMLKSWEKDNLLIVVE